MIKLTQIKDIQKYFDNVPDEAVAFLENATKETPNGKYPFTDDCFINVMDCDTKDDLTAMMEVHDKFVDVQFMIDGEEKIYYTDRTPLELGEAYNEVKDRCFYKWEKGDIVTYQTGEAVVLYPQEAHLPGRAVNAPMTAKKAVMKVRAK